jgi:drug/metabolite transporter (DMT)-like permease
MSELSTPDTDTLSPARGRTSPIASTIRAALASPYLLLAGAPFFWAGNFVVGRALRDDVAPISLTFWRWAITLAILLPLSGRQLRHHRAGLRREWKLLAATGASGLVVYPLLTYSALTTTTAINATLIGASTPLVIALCAWLVLREAITPRQGLGLSLALVGVAAVIARGQLGTLLALRLNIGDLWMAGAVLAWSVYSVLLKRCTQALPSLVVLTATVGFSVLLLAPVELWHLAQIERLAVSAPGLLGIGYIAICSSVLASLAWTKGVAALGPSRAAGFFNLLPIFTALQASVLLGERIAPYHLAGAAFVFAGVVLASWRHQPGTEPFGDDPYA